MGESSSNLSDGAQTQSASVEEMTASVDELTSAVQSISGSAGSAREQAEETASSARQSGKTVTEAVNAMRLIEKSSEQINDIIQVISEIARQTDLLALNAAIEAARAGEHGLGFAVVADEVRKLSERSSEAAKEITQLIKESSRRVAEGAQLSERVGESLAGIVDAINETAASIASIAEQTEAQASSAEQVQSGIKSISETTETNAASAEAAGGERRGARRASAKPPGPRGAVQRVDMTGSTPSGSGVQLVQLSRSQFEQFRTFIYSKSGIRVPDNKLSLLSNRIRRRLKAGDFSDFDTYYTYLTSSKGRSELEHFLDAITTNETFFFRTEAHFDWLKDEFFTELVGRGATGRARSLTQDLVGGMRDGGRALHDRHLPARSATSLSGLVAHSARNGHQRAGAPRCARGDLPASGRRGH